MNTVESLENAIRKVRDDWVRGDDKCWKDLVELFRILPEGFTLPATDTCVELQYCEQYIRSCHHPDVVYVSPQRRIEQLEAEIERLKKPRTVKDALEACRKWRLTPEQLAELDR